MLDDSFLRANRKLPLALKRWGETRNLESFGRCPICQEPPGAAFDSTDGYWKMTHRCGEDFIVFRHATRWRWVVRCIAVHPGWQWCFMTIAVVIIGAVAWGVAR